MTLFSDIESGRIVHAVEGRKIEDITRFLLKLRRKAKKLKAIAIHMSVPYISAVEQFLRKSCLTCCMANRFFTHERYNKIC